MEAREPSALTGRARLMVTAWVLVIVPVLLAMALSAILLFPKLAASTWESGSQLVARLPIRTSLGGWRRSRACSRWRCRCWAWRCSRSAWSARRSEGARLERGRRPRQALVSPRPRCSAALLAWAWWPSGQYQPVRPTDGGTLVSAVQTVSAPQPRRARPAAARRGWPPGRTSRSR